jgi:perosamine synthetase
VIPVNEPVLGEREVEYVSECVRTGWVSSAGRFIEAFEKGWAEYCGRRYGVAVSNGTVALQAGVAVLGLKPGDEVIMPTFTIISCGLGPSELGHGCSKDRREDYVSHQGNHACPHLRSSS